MEKTGAVESSADALSPRSRAKRREILEVAGELFSERGFEKTSLKTLAAEAQVSTSTIYTYFGDKDDLLDQVIRTRLDSLLEETVDEVDEARDPIEELVEGVRRVNGRVAGDRLLARIATYQRHVVGQGLREHAQRVIERLEQACTASLRRAIAEGRFRCEDPQALNAVFRLSMQGWLLSSLQGTEVVSEPRMTEALVDLIRAAAGSTSARGDDRAAKLPASQP